MTGAVRHFPIFDAVPGSEYGAGFLLHVERTGYPETYEGVSTSKPERLDGVRFLTEEVKVVTSLRLGGDWVPCALCRPTSPKCQKGRLAYFPLEKTVCFVGRNCAQKHMGDAYNDAQQLWDRQSRSEAVIKRWADMQARLPEWEAFALRVKPVARSLQWMHEKLHDDAPEFALTAYDALKWTSGLIRAWEDIGVKDDAGKPILQHMELGKAEGWRFLRHDFRPLKTLQRLQATMKEAGTALPVLTDSEDQETMMEIIRRGRAAFAVAKSLNDLDDEMVAARQFFATANLRLFEAWFKSGGSPWSKLEFYRKANVIYLRSESERGAGYCNLTVLKDLDGEPPPRLEEFA